MSSHNEDREPNVSINSEASRLWRRSARLATSRVEFLSKLFRGVAANIRLSRQKLADLKCSYTRDPPIQHFFEIIESPAKFAHEQSLLRFPQSRDLVLPRSSRRQQRSTSPESPASQSGARIECASPAVQRQCGPKTQASLLVIVQLTSINHLFPFFINLYTSRLVFDST